MSSSSCALVPDLLVWSPPAVSPSMRSLAGESRPLLRLVTEETSRERERVFPKRTQAAAVYRRRRIAAVVAVVGMLMMVRPAGAAIAATNLKGLSGSPASAAEQQVVTHVVQPGDSYWSIARSLAPEADPRPIVYDLRRAHGGKELMVGDVIEWYRGR